MSQEISIIGRGQKQKQYHFYLYSSGFEMPAIRVKCSYI